ncbi:hypothetical protein EYF80_033277 [Liparis tanakae]|uniref:Uncharacterized protein n=1 Tax=Liparis tanakae TaxID=230148 RepID=A0A4Z2GTA3_9TELE|nr:hypothetical protein EYF80_033277 [Liparis tanakae]
MEGHLSEAFEYWQKKNEGNGSCMALIRSLVPFSCGGCDNKRIVRLHRPPSDPGFNRLASAQIKERIVTSTNPDDT